MKRPPEFDWNWEHVPVPGEVVEGLCGTCNAPIQHVLMDDGEPVDCGACDYERIRLRREEERKEFPFLRPYPPTRKEWEDVKLVKYAVYFMRV